MGDRPRFNLSVKFSQQDKYDALQANFNEEYLGTEKEIDSGYTKKIMLDSLVTTVESNEHAQLRKKLDNLSFRNNQKQRVLESLIKSIQKLEPKTTDSQSNMSNSTDKTFSSLYNKVKDLEKQIEEIEFSELLELEITNQLDNM